MPPTKSIRGLLAASVAVFVLTLVFMMTLVILATMFGKQVPPGSRFLVVVVLALGAGFGAAGMGGEAALRGKIPIPGTRDHPLAVGATGGVAVMLIVLFMRDAIVPIDPETRDLRLRRLTGVETGATPPRVMVTAAFDGFSAPPGGKVLLALCSDRDCQSVLRTDQIDDPRLGTMTVFLAVARNSVAAGRLIVEHGQSAQQGEPTPTTW